jgi:hypothetical protein
MTQGAFFLVTDPTRVDPIMQALHTTIKNMPADAFPQAIKLEAYQDPRSTPQLALLHIWFREIAKSFTERGNAVKPEFIKEMLKHHFLGTTDISTEKLKLPPQINKLPKKKGELNYFMVQIEDWSADHGVRLSNPADSEYMKLKEAQFQ